MSFIVIPVFYTDYTCSHVLLFKFLCKGITAIFEFPAYLDRFDYWDGFKGWAEVKCVDGCFNLL